MPNPLAALLLQTMPALEPLETLSEPSWVDGWGRSASAWIGVAVLAWISNFVARRIIVRGVRAVVTRTKTKWDDVLVEHRVFQRLSQIAPAAVVYLAAPFLFSEPEQAAYLDFLHRFADAWTVVALAWAVHAFLGALVVIGQRSSTARDKPLRSYAQVVQLILWLATGILVVSILMQRSPWALLTGLGAMTAILLLVFKDSILGFVASIRIASNDMLRTGDWVEMPKYGADGDVVDIGLHTVKIQNWDKTISMIPTHTFMTDTFKNWRGMTESGGRRIKRSLHIDMSSVRFLVEDDVERLRRVQILRPYLEEAKSDFAAWNQEHDIDESNAINGRQLTNLGTLRAYIERYLQTLEPIRQDMTFLVRQLAPTPQGIPMEIYCFSGEQRWVHYEKIMGDIFDHLLSVVHAFDLRVYQQPAGEDVRALATGPR
ncbi:MAG: mechanosensitive ion channel domain-containing protein [Planctomycetota bacterium]